MLIKHLGRVDYEPTYQAMVAFTDNRTEDTADELWIVEHPPVFTQGMAGKAEHLLQHSNIPVVQVDRGGQITYHGPGQVVVYTMIDFKRRHISVRDLVSRLENSIIATLAHFGIEAHNDPKRPGVYVGEGKIASLGLRIKRGSVYHGLALNVNMDLAPFHQINPCGYAGLEMVQMAELVSPTPEFNQVADILADHLQQQLTVEEAHMSQDNAQGVKHKGAAKTARIPIKVVPLETKLKKPEWIRAKLPSGGQFMEIKRILREQKLHTVCEEASCPNIGECFSKGTATFMIMGDICTRRCPFCDVGHGRPNPLDPEEPKHLAETVAALKLKYVVITSVDRDDLRDGGAGHFAECIKAIRELSPSTQIEVLVPDFRGRLDVALEILAETPPDVMNHNLETAPRLYKQARPGADYTHSLELLKRYKALRPDVATKSGIMVGLGEDDEEVRAVMRDMREYNIDMITIGQYLQPTDGHLPVLRYVSPQMFKTFETEALDMGFKHAAVGAMVRSSYHADEQAKDAGFVE